MNINIYNLQDSRINNMFFQESKDIHSLTIDSLSEEHTADDTILHSILWRMLTSTR